MELNGDEVDSTTTYHKTSKLDTLLPLSDSFSLSEKLIDTSDDYILKKDQKSELPDPNFKLELVHNSRNKDLFSLPSKALINVCKKENFVQDPVVNIEKSKCQNTLDVGNVKNMCTKKNVSNKKKSRQSCNVPSISKPIATLDEESQFLKSSNSDIFHKEAKFSFVQNRKGSEIENSERLWKLWRYNQDFYNENEIPSVIIEQKHRREKRHKDVDSNLFSSVRYEVYVTLQSNSSKQLDLQKCHNIHARLVPYEVHPDGSVYPLEPNSKFDGINHAILRKHPKSRKFKDALFTNQLLIHFDSSLSHYFTRNDYIMDLELFAESADLDGHMNKLPLLVYRSPIVRVYARKANKKKTDEDCFQDKLNLMNSEEIYLGKRKREAYENTVTKSPTKTSTRAQILQHASLFKNDSTLENVPFYDSSTSYTEPILQGFNPL